jgi:uncharacterized membrane protein YdjX (TVP38/TMEM64 family)
MNKIMKKNEKINIVIGAVILILIILLSFIVILHLYNKKDIITENKIKTFVLEHGFFAPIVLILLISLQVIIAPIPGQVFSLASGYLYGGMIGTIISMSGLMIGSTIVLMLARNFGRPLVEYFISKKKITKFDNFFERRKGPYSLVILFILPIFPDDIVCFVAGLTKIPFKNLLLIIFFGRLPGILILNYMGAGFNYESIFITLFLLTISIIFITFVLLKKEMIINYYFYKKKQIKKKIHLIEDKNK